MPALANTAFPETTATVVRRSLIARVRAWLDRGWTLYLGNARALAPAGTPRR